MCIAVVSDASLTMKQCPYTHGAPLPAGLSREQMLEEMGVILSEDEARPWLPGAGSAVVGGGGGGGGGDGGACEVQATPLPYPHALRIITKRDPDCLTGKEKGLRIVLILSAESEEEMRLWHDVLLASKAEALEHARMATRFDWFACVLA